MPRYHPEVGLPAGLNLPQGRFRLRPTPHAWREAAADAVLIPSWLNTRTCLLFEVVTTERGEVIKLGLRTVVDATRDICLMVTDLHGQVWTVLTVWVNDREDVHRTLRRNEYDAVPASI